MAKKTKTKSKTKKSKQKKTWREKLSEAKAKEGLPTTIVVPSVGDVEAQMRKARKGRLITTERICQALAKQHGTDRACPMTTGLFVWMLAGAADEEAQAGTKRILPYWRTLKTDGELNPKYPGGLAAQRRMLEAEGHKVVRRGKTEFVQDYDKRLVKV